MSDFSTLFGVNSIKSIQRGSTAITPSGTSGSQAVTISAVDTSKAFVLHGGAHGGNLLASSGAQLTNSTTVTIYYQSSSTGITPIIHWQVVEFN